MNRPSRLAHHSALSLALGTAGIAGLGLGGVIAVSNAPSVRAGPATINLAQADTSGFIPILWAQRALAVLRTKIRLAKIIARDTDFTPEEKGKAITIPFPGTFTAQTLTDSGAGSTATLQSPVGGGSVTVNLDKFKYVDFTISDFARAQASMELMDRYIDGPMDALAIALEADLFALYAGLTGGSVGTAGTNLVRPVITGAKKKLSDNLAPESDRHLVLSTKDEAAMLNDTSLANYFAFSKPDAVAEGSLGTIDGLTLWPSTMVPVTGSGPATTQNIAFHKNALILATRPLSAPAASDGVQAGVVVDPESGLALRILKQYDMSIRGYRVGFDMLYGVKVLRPTQGINVLS